MKPRLPLSEKVLPFLFIVIAAIVFIDIWRLPYVETTDKVGPKFYPWLLALLLAICAGLLLMGFERVHKSSEITLQAMLRKFLPMTLICFLYIYAMSLLGFLISTTALLIACFYLLGERKHWRNVLIALCCTAATYLLFATALGVQIPALPGSSM